MVLLEMLRMLLVYNLFLYRIQQQLQFPVEYEYIYFLMLIF